MPALVWLDLSASHAHAWAATTGDFAPLTLDGQHTDLPLQIGLDRRQPVVGRAAESLRYDLSPALCAGFIPRLGTGQRWQWGRHNLDAEAALQVSLQKVRDVVGAGSKVFLTLPTYLSPEQNLVVRRVCQNLGWKLLGHARRGHAFGLAQHEEHPWPHAAVVAEWDEHALVATLLRPLDGRVHYLGRMVVPAAGRAMWRRQLIHAFSRASVVHLRRDPRDLPETEPLLHTQAETLLATGAAGPVTLTLPLPTGVQRLQLEAATLHAALRGLHQLTVQALATVLGQTLRPAGTGHWLLPHELLNAPGLAAAVYAHADGGVAVRRLTSNLAPAMLTLMRGIDAGTLHPTPDGLPLPVSDHAEPTEEILPFPELADDEPTPDVKVRMPPR